MDGVAEWVPAHKGQGQGGGRLRQHMGQQSQHRQRQGRQDQCRRGGGGAQVLPVEAAGFCQNSAA